MTQATKGCEAVLAGATEEYRVASRADFNLAEQDTYSSPEPVREVA